MKTIKRMFKKYRKTKIAACILALIIIIPIVVVNVTPTPSALFVRKLFEESGKTKPVDYKQAVKKVNVKNDLEFTSKYDLNTFDLYSPIEANQISDRPTIVWVHGGAFVGGDKRDTDIFATKLASDGYTVVSMNYELAPEAKYPTPVLQVAELVEYLQQNADKFPNVNLDNVFFAGDSAGAQVATQYMITQTNDAYRNEMKFKQQLDASAVNGMLLYCGPYDVEQLTDLSSSDVVKFILNQVGWSYLGEKDWKSSELLKEVNVIAHVTKDFPASYITDGNTASFEQQGKDLVKKLSELGVNVEQRFFKVSEHKTAHEYQFKMDTEAAVIAYEDTIKFLNEHQK